MFFQRILVGYQWYEYTGIFGGSLWVLVVNVLLFHTLRFFLHEKDKKLFYKRIAGIGLLLLLPIIISLGIYSHYTEQGEAYRSRCPTAQYRPL